MRRTRSASQPGSGAVPAKSPVPTSTRVLRSHTVAEAATRSRVAKAKGITRRRRADPWAPKRKRNPDPKPRPPPPTHFTCRICIEEQTTDQFPAYVPSKRGDWESGVKMPIGCIPHLNRKASRRDPDPVCQTCIGKTMSARLDMLGARRVGDGCIDRACSVEWDWKFIMRYMPPGEPTEKYNLEMFEVWKRDATIKPVTCTAPDCEAMGLPDHTAPGYPQVSCHSCAHRFCAQCLVPWHEDLTCTEHAVKLFNETISDTEKETLKLMQTKDGKRCPNCYFVIEKDGGCDSMFCMGCQKYFNWATAASAIPGANKAQPIRHNDPYWYQRPDEPPVVCEMDAVQKAGTTTAAAAA